VDGGGKDGRRPLGCGLEKRPPCPRRTGQKGMRRSSERGVSLRELQSCLHPKRSAALGHEPFGSELKAELLGPNGVHAEALSHAEGG